MIRQSRGQALIILIFAIALAITILSGVTLAAITLGKNTRLSEDAQTAYFAAEGGAEYALLKLIRNPAGCANPSDNLTLDTTTVTISYSLVGSTCTVLAISNKGTVQKKVQLQATINASRVDYCCWQELP